MHRLETSTFVGVGAGYSCIKLVKLSLEMLIDE
jgi:hypothetical protein